MDAIRIENLSKNYGKNRGIVDVTLAVSEGDWYGFIGPNGAGKSTTIRTLLGLIRPTSGKASIFNLDTYKNHVELMDRVGYLPSEAIFYPGMTVKEFLSYSLSLHKTSNSEYQKELVERFELDLNKKIGELSYGNRKKVGIVNALQHHPSLLIMDEPTGGLDPLMQKEFFSVLERENNNGTTIFFSSHVLSEIERYAKKAAFIKDGKIIFTGDVSSLSKTTTRRVSLRGDVDISHLEGIRKVIEDGDKFSFLFSGDPNTLLKTMSEGRIKDFVVTEPDLEEIFLHFYKDENL